MNETEILTGDTGSSTTDVVATSADTRADMTKRAARGYAQLRHLLVQLPQEVNGSRASTIATMLKKRKHRALVLYLLLMTCWPWLKDWKSPLEAAVWLRALNAPGGLTWSASTLSRAWADLETLGLLKRHRDGRRVRVVPQREDGNEDYEQPSGLAGEFSDIYFQLPDAFWLDEMFAKLDLPSLVMFLLFLKETNGKKEIQLTHQQFQDWYGISVSSAKKGINGLKEHGLLDWRDMTQKAPLTKAGSTKLTWYWLTGPYSYEERDRLRRAAADAANARAKKAAAKRLAKKAAAGGTGGESSNETSSG